MRLYPLFYRPPSILKILLPQSLEGKSQKPLKELPPQPLSIAYPRTLIGWVEGVDPLASRQREGVTPTEERSIPIYCAAVPPQKDAAPADPPHLIGKPSLMLGRLSKGEDGLACRRTYLLCLTFEEEDPPSPSGGVAATCSASGAEEPNSSRIVQDQPSPQPASGIWPEVIYATLKPGGHMLLYPQPINGGIQVF